MTVQVSTIFLYEPSTKRMVQAELRDSIESGQLEDWSNAWQPASKRIRDDLKARNAPYAEWPQSWHWKWDTKVAQISNLLGFRTFCVVCGGMTQGLMRVDLNKFCVLPQQQGKPLVYVDYIEVAPWNYPVDGAPPLYKGIGSALIGAAIDLSLVEDFKGRIGLHSLPQAHHFYKTTCGMVDLGADSNCQGLHYFEMTPDQGARYLTKER